MTTEMARADPPAVAAVADSHREAAAGALVELFASGDLSRLSNEQRVGYYLELCRSLGLNSLSRPFSWLVLDNRLVLYDNASCAEQLRRQHQISVRVIRREVAGEHTADPMAVVEVEGRTPTGRVDQAIKYVPLTATNRQGQRYRLSGKALADAYAKVETGAKRRLVKSMVGLAGLPDDPEKGRPVIVDGTGNVVEHPDDMATALAARPGMAAAIGEPTFETAPSETVPFEGMSFDQAPTEAELTPPKRSGPRPTFTPSEQQVNLWLRTWHATVDQTSLDDEHERHRFVRQWTEDRTDSLRTFFETATKRQAEDLLGHVRALVEDEKRAGASAGQEAEREQEEAC